MHNIRAVESAYPQLTDCLAFMPTDLRLVILAKRNNDVLLNVLIDANMLEPFWEEFGSGNIPENLVDLSKMFKNILIDITSLTSNSSICRAYGYLAECKDAGLLQEKYSNINLSAYMLGIYLSDSSQYKVYTYTDTLTSIQKDTYLLGKPDSSSFEDISVAEAPIIESFDLDISKVNSQHLGYVRRRDSSSEYLTLWENLR